MDEDVAYQVARAMEDFGRAQRQIGAQLARSLDLPRAGIGIVRILRRDGAVQVGCLAQALRVDLSVASRQVSTLVDAGLLRRTVGDDDRRARTVELTDAGTAVADEIRDRLVATVSEVFAGWDPDELTVAAAHMSALARAITEHHDDVDRTTQQPTKDHA
jgi:DNA-binding MarR family transcriptional regulator